MQLNPSKPLAGIVATLFFLYLVFIFLSGSPLERTDRVCAPVFSWGKKMVVAATDVFSPAWSASVGAKFDSGMTSCRLWVWNAFYRDDYLRLKETVRTDSGGLDGQQGGGRP